MSRFNTAIRMPKTVQDLDLEVRPETRPRDFRARFTRRASHRRLRQLARRRWTIMGSAAGLIALPAFGAPGTWQTLQSINQGFSIEQPAPMPFERKGASFPGSAFYYIDSTASSSVWGSQIHSDTQPPNAPFSNGLGPAARSMVIAGTIQDRARALKCMTQAIYYEAGSEPDAGQRAVAQVVLNRVAHPAFPDTVCGVVYQGSGRADGCQFTFTCDGSLARRPSALFWDRAKQIARIALAGYVYAPVGLATHYHTIQVHPYWASSLHYLETIGAHRFYALNGPAGNLAAFHAHYTGNEPLPAPLPRENEQRALADAAISDPIAIQKAYQTATLQEKVPSFSAQQIVHATTLAPESSYNESERAEGGDRQYKATSLPSSSGVRPEYSNSGRWIASPVR